MQLKLVMYAHLVVVAWVEAVLVPAGSCDAEAESAGSAAAVAAPVAVAGPVSAYYSTSCLVSPAEENSFN